MLLERNLAEKETDNKTLEKRVSEIIAPYKLSL